MTWPSTNVPATAPTDHGDVRTQAYQAGGGDYFRTGQYAYGTWSSGAMTTLAGLLNVLRVRPFLVPVRRSFDRIGVDVSTAATAGGVIRFGIYNTVAGEPSGLVLETAGVASTSTGAKEAIISVTLDPGLYWIANVTQVATATVRAFATTATPVVSFDTTPPSGLQGASYRTTNTVSGALPATFTISSWGDAMHATCLRAV